MRASFWIRDQPHYRRHSFWRGLEANGYRVVPDVPIERPEPTDVLVIWNRYGWFHTEAQRFEAAGARVLVAENGYLGNDFAGDRWYAISLWHHNGAGGFPYLPERWDALGVEFESWHTGGTEIVLLPQRGIGPPGVAMPADWAYSASRCLQGREYRVRAHPGVKDCKPLRDDLARAAAVVTWGSGAALKALLWGIPCFHAFGLWIGAGASTAMPADVDKPQRPDRLETFRRIASAMWRLSEIESGAAFAHLLGMR